MDAERWGRIESLYYAAIDLEPRERQAFVADRCQGDEDLRREIERLLAQGDSSIPGFDLTEAGASAELSAGTQLGPYRIESLIGSGGMGRVYKAQDMRLGRPVAIKTARRRFGERFEREAKAIASLNHPNVCTLYDVGPDYLVLELIEGETLASRLGKGRLPVKLVIHYASQIAAALAAAHSQAFVHRDLKPGNVMVTLDDQIKVLDFGLAKVNRPESDRKDSSLTSAKTEEGMILGTIAYMSPEQAGGKPSDTRSDIFSFGAVLYEMLSGKPAFQGKNRLSTLTAILESEPKPMCEAAKGIPTELERLVLRCLRKDPAMRWQHMADVRVALEESKVEALQPGRTGLRPLRIWQWLMPVLLAALGVTAWLVRPERTVRTAVWEPTPVTSYRGSESEPTLSPDGKQVAFLWDGKDGSNVDIYVTLVSRGSESPPLRLTQDPASESSPAWSPDGTRIAFYRDSFVYTISPLGGAERRVTDNIVFQGISPCGRRAAPSLAWSPDGKLLAVTELAGNRVAYGVTLVDALTGAKRQLTSPRELTCDLKYSFAPDGSELAFVRFSPGGTSDLYKVPLTGGEPIRLTTRKQEISGTSWHQQTGVLFASLGTLFAVQETGAEPRALGSLGSGFFTTSSSGRIVFTQSSADYNIWELEAGGEPRQVVASSVEDMWPVYSPDGSKIAFASNRSGHHEIWVSDRDGANLTQVTHMGGMVVSSRWSPDGKLLVFTGGSRGERDVYTIPAAGGSPRRLTTDPAEEGRASFSRDGKFIYFFSNSTGTSQIWKMSADGGTAVRITKLGGNEAIESFDGSKLYFVRIGGPGLMSVPVDGGEEKLEHADVRMGRWDVTRKGIVYLGRISSQESHPVMLWNPELRITKQIGVFRGRVMEGGRRVFSATSDATRFLLSQMDRLESDLMLLEDFR